MPTPEYVVLGASAARPAVTTMAINIAVHAPAATSQFVDRNAGSLVRIRKALAASHAAARLNSPNTPSAGLVGSWTIHAAMTI